MAGGGWRSESASSARYTERITQNASLTTLPSHPYAREERRVAMPGAQGRLRNGLGMTRDASSTPGYMSGITIFFAITISTRDGKISCAGDVVKKASPL